MLTFFIAFIKYICLDKLANTDTEQLQLGFYLNVQSLNFLFL